MAEAEAQRLNRGTNKLSFVGPMSYLALSYASMTLIATCTLPLWRLDLCPWQKLSWELESCNICRATGFPTSSFLLGKSTGAAASFIPPHVNNQSCGSKRTCGWWSTAWFRLLSQNAWLTWALLAAIRWVGPNGVAAGQVRALDLLAVNFPRGSLCKECGQVQTVSLRVIAPCANQP